jgi:hypothetical protein
MKNLVFVLLVFVAGVFGFGLYRGWFTVNEKKIEQDEAAVKSEMHELERNVKEKVSDTKSPVKELN